MGSQTKENTRTVPHTIIVDEFEVCDTKAQLLQDLGEPRARVNPKKKAGPGPLRNDAWFRARNCEQLMQDVRNAKHQLKTTWAVTRLLQGAKNEVRSSNFADTVQQRNSRTMTTQSSALAWPRERPPPSVHGAFFVPRRGPWPCSSKRKRGAA